MKITEFFGFVASVIAIGGAAYWVLQTNDRISTLERASFAGIGAMSQSDQEKDSNEKTEESGSGATQNEITNPITVGRTKLETLCYEVGTSIRRAANANELSAKVSLERQFNDLNCKKIMGAE